MTFDESIKALHQSAIVQGVNIESLHSSCAELHASMAETRLSIIEMRTDIKEQGKNIDSLTDSIKTVLASLNNLAIIAQSHHQRISVLEDGSRTQ